MSLEEWTPNTEEPKSPMNDVHQPGQPDRLDSEPGCVSAVLVGLPGTIWIKRVPVLQPCSFFYPCLLLQVKHRRYRGGKETF